MKRNVVFKLAKGFSQRGKNNYRITANRVDKSLLYAYRDRRTKKRNFRLVWQQQINAATRQFGVAYSQFMHGLARSNVALNRKILAHLAVSEPFTFETLVNEAKKVEGIPWKDTHAARLTKTDYLKYIPQLPPAEFYEGVPRTPAEIDTLAKKKLGEEYAKADAKAAEVNAELIRAGKVVIRKATTDESNKKAKKVKS